MKIFIDDREQKRIKSALDYYADEGFQVGENMYVMELPVGDYIFTDNKIQVAFEYKTIEDYIASLNDYRVFNQAINQSNNFDYHFVIIVGTDKEKTEVIKSKKKYTGSYVTNKQYYGGLASLVNFTSILQVPNEKLAFMLMLQVAVKCCDLKPVLKRFKKSRGSPALRLLTNNVAGIGYVTAENICRELGLVSVSDVLNVSKADLVSVGGVGSVTADKILEQLHNEFDF